MSGVSCPGSLLVLQESHFTRDLGYHNSAHLSAARLASGSRPGGMPWDRSPREQPGVVAVCLGSALCGKIHTVMTSVQCQSTQASEMHFKSI